MVYREEGIELLDGLLKELSKEMRDGENWKQYGGEQSGVTVSIGTPSEAITQKLIRAARECTGGWETFPTSFHKAALIAARWLFECYVLERNDVKIVRENPEELIFDGGYNSVDEVEKEAEMMEHHSLKTLELASAYLDLAM